MWEESAMIESIEGKEVCHDTNHHLYLKWAYSENPL